MEKNYGPDSHEVVNTLLYFVKDVYPGADGFDRTEPYCRRALAIVEKTHGPDSSEQLFILDTLIGLYLAQRWHIQAEPLLQRSLNIQEKLHGPEAQELVPLLDLLAGLYDDQALFAHAEPLYRRVVAIQ